MNPKAQNMETAQVVDNLLHVSSYWGVNSIVGRTTHKTLPFCSKNSGPILITS